MDAALKAGLPCDAETRLCDLLLGPLFDGFRRSLSGDPPASAEPFQVKLKADTDLSKVKERPRVYSPARTAWLDKQFAQLTEAGMVYENPQAIYSNVAQAVPKGNGYSLVGGFKPVNRQSEPVAAPPVLLEETGVGVCRSGAVHDGGSEPGLLANAAGCEFAGIIHVCDAEGSTYADANAPRSDECNLVLPGNAGEDAR